MRIIFNLVKCGLANNGGSQTLIRSAIGLKSLGHDVTILLDKENKFTWFDFDKSILKYIDVSTKTSEWPLSDIIIATACSTVNDTINYPHLNIERKFYWVRAIETWAMSIEELKKGYSSGLKIMCNSEWQCRFLHRMGIDSVIQYPGLTIDVINSINKELNNDESKKRTIGALFSTKKRKCPERIVEICNIAHSFGLIDHVNLLSNETSNNYFNKLAVPHTIFIRPSFYDKIKMMNDSMIWLATTDNEGLHIPPMEAGLSGCNIVCNKVDSAGMGDYAIDGFSSLNFKTNGEAISCISRYVNDEKTRKMHSSNFKSIIINKIGNVEENMKCLEKKLLIACGLL
jgi:hypothetical protein